MLIKGRKEGRKEEKSANALASWAAGSVHRKHFVGAFITKQARVEFYKQSAEQQCDLETFKHSKACSLRVCREHLPFWWIAKNTLRPPLVKTLAWETLSRGYWPFQVQGGFQLKCRSQTTVPRDSRVCAEESVLALAGMESWSLAQSGTQPGGKWWAEWIESPGPWHQGANMRCSTHSSSIHAWDGPGPLPHPVQTSTQNPFQQSPPAATTKKRKKKIQVSTL